MYATSEQLVLHSPQAMHDYYYSMHISQAGLKLQRLLGENEKIHFFPEATLKSNRFPNGVAVYSRLEEATLVPSLLRDPGCGFLIFKFLPDQLVDEMAIRLAIQRFCTCLESGMNPDSAIKHPQSLLQEVLRSGVTSMDHSYTDRFVMAKCDIDDALSLETNDYAALYNELNNITNTVELKKIIDFKCKVKPGLHFSKGEVIGIIHTGTDVFPRILHRNFFKKIADHAYLSGLVSVDEIRSGYYAIPLSDETGYQYYQWIKAAMNYCVFKRWYIFNELAKFLNRELKLEIEMLNDRVHAGAIVMDNQSNKMLIQSRGVQNFFHSAAGDSVNHFLLAGQRESISFLLTPSAANQPADAIGHGTSYSINEDYNYRQLLGEENALQYEKMCDNLSANTAVDSDACLAYTYNIINQLQYMIDMNYCDAVHCLMPLSNYQGKSLVQRLTRESSHG